MKLKPYTVTIPAQLEIIDALKEIESLLLTSSDCSIHVSKDSIFITNLHKLQFLIEEKTKQSQTHIICDDEIVINTTIEECFYLAFVNMRHKEISIVDALGSDLSKNLSQLVESLAHELNHPSFEIFINHLTIKFKPTAFALNENISNNKSMFF
ncbi:hypothetical protein ABT56_19055 [Photobacterium aquae]|uniref:Uncharacterized protein n=1 Tax=Photobacterium aquae TaxID=1195763 RepID=A0A0J1GVQ5_9GAMM|nr:hypothetical protein [Photobacterium aquae]KLV03529.1 hypothetical protein ABT56_19055 [Photobacterium aquae]